MKSNYKKLGEYIREVNIRNSELAVDRLLGVSIRKVLMPSIANIVGTNMETYKIIKRNQFAYGPVTSRNGDKISIALLEDYDEAIVSQAYVVFEVIDENELLPEYAMMWFRRPEFDRYARFKSHGSARETFDWDELCETELPIPSIKKQREIVAEFNTITNRIALNEQLNQKLEETAQTLYKHWFVDFNFPITKESCPELVSGSPHLKGKPYKSSGGDMVWCYELDMEIPVGWEICDFRNHVSIIMGQSPKGDTYNFVGEGMPLINGPVEFGKYYTERKKWTSSPTKISKKGDLIVCVRGSTVGKFVKSDGSYCLGRGVCALRSTKYQYFVDVLYRTLRQELESLSTGSTFPSWDREMISTVLTINPIDDVLVKFEFNVSSIFGAVELNELENVKLLEIRELLLSKMSN